MYSCFEILELFISSQVLFLVDINECSILNGGCSYRCENTVGSYKCVCSKGYELQSNGRTCVNINECLNETTCDSKNGICTDNAGSHRCSCRNGYSLQYDGKTCTGKNGFITSVRSKSIVLVIQVRWSSLNSVTIASY